MVSCGSRSHAVIAKHWRRERLRGSAWKGTYFFRILMKVLNLEPSLGFSSVMAGGFSAAFGVVMLGGVKFVFRSIRVRGHR